MNEHQKQIRAMLKAIDLAKGKSTRTDGLRVIRSFEDVNGVAFDPNNLSHQLLVCGRGDTEGFFRAIRLKRKKGIL